MNDEPVWKRPGWITAIIGLLSAMLTIPNITGEYLIAREKTVEIRTKNAGSKQEQETKVINQIISQQGTERIFYLRYLAATLDDELARKWAANEVSRLESIAQQEEELLETKELLKIKEDELKKISAENIENTEKSEEKKKLEKEVMTLEVKLKAKDLEISELRQKAGILDDRKKKTQNIE